MTLLGCYLLVGLTWAIVAGHLQVKKCGVSWHLLIVIPLNTLLWPLCAPLGILRNFVRR